MKDEAVELLLDALLLVALLLLLCGLDRGLEESIFEERGSRQW